MLELESGNGRKEEEKDDGDKEESVLHFDHNTCFAELLRISIVSGKLQIQVWLTLLVHNATGLYSGRRY